MTSRQPAGIPVGGQFAPGTQARSALTLVGDPLTQPLDPAAWHGIDPAAAADFERLGFTPQSAAEWDAHAFTPDEAYAWSRTEHVSAPSLAQSWRESGIAAAEADQWAANGFAAVDTGIYTGIAPHVAKTWRGKQTTGWRSWAERGISYDEADDYKAHLGWGISAEHAATFRSIGMDGQTAAGWNDNRFTADEAALWSGHGFTADQARTWLSADLPAPSVDEATVAPEETEPTGADYTALDEAIEDESVDDYAEAVASLGEEHVRYHGGIRRNRYSDTTDFEGLAEARAEERAERRMARDDRRY